MSIEQRVTADAAPSTAPATSAEPAPEIRIVDDNGSWCWFQDERSLADPETGTVVIGAVASAGGTDGAERGGDVELIVAREDGSSSRVVLHAGLESDDHDDPALWRRADGRWLAVYSRHKTDELTRWRISDTEDPAGEWGEEQAYSWTLLFGATEPAPPHTPGRGVTYQNVHPLDGRLYCFVRAVNDDPCYLISHDDGSTWEFGGRLLTRPKIGYVNGYARYASGTHHGTDDRIDLIITEHHPRDYATSIWHGYLAGGSLHRADGTVVSALGRGIEETAPRAEDLTPLFTSGSTWGGSVMTHAWTTDLRRGADGRLVALFTARADDALGTDTARHAWDAPAHEVPAIDHRLFRAELAPGAGAWKVHEIAVAGPQLMPHEEDYTGLGAIDPDDLDALWASLETDPRDGRTLGVHEIFHGRTADGGATIAWTPVTEGSAGDNLRPVAIPGDPGRAAVTWFRGTMRRSQDLDTEVVLLSSPRTPGR